MVQEKSSPLTAKLYSHNLQDLTALCKKQGVRSLSDVELISALFQLDHPTSLRWLKQSGSLSTLVNDSPVGQAIIEFARRYAEEDIKRGDILSNVSAVRDYLIMCFRGYSHEVFSCLFLDNRHRIICHDELFKGTIDACSVYPREVIRRVIKHNAAAVIFAHNHPSGVTEPSQADHQITEQLKNALNMIDCRVLDHFIVGDDVLSFVERGYL